jgi:hypothetical protein
MLNFAKPPAETEFETGPTPSTNFAEVLVETLFSDSVDVLRVVDPDETVVDAEIVLSAETTTGPIPPAWAAANAAIVHRKIAMLLARNRRDISFPLRLRIAHGSVFKCFYVPHNYT